jgi:copper chaperone CopZ
MKYFKYLVALFILTVVTATTTNAQTTKETPQDSQTLQTIKIKVTGITCKGDCKDIQESISKLNGVTATQQVGKPAATSLFEITFNPALVTEKQIQRSVEDTPGCDDPEKRPYKVKKGDN